MSDLGLDAYALDDADPAGHPHPLEIARDLIATGRLRSALEVLSLHHEQLDDDPEYLMLCSEAWFANGDALRAQQALLGAARLAPEDPRPLLCLGELLAQRGEHDKAERVLAKARALQHLASDSGEQPDATADEAEHDLIAFAERRERSSQAALTAGQFLIAALVLLAVALLIVGISFIASPSEGVPSSRGAAPHENAATPRGSAAADRASPSRNAAAAGKTSPSSDLDVSGSPSRVEHPPISVSTERAAMVEDVGEVAPIGKEGSQTRSEPLPEPLLLPPSPILQATEGTDAPERDPAPRGPAPAKEASLTSSSMATVAATLPSRKAAPSQPRKAAAEQRKKPSAAAVQVELASMDPKQLTERADRLYAQGHTGIAAIYYRRALEIDPDYAPALVGIGQSILRAEKYSEAMTNATRALQLARGVDARPGLEATAIYQMGRVHYERGERDSARRLLRQSISLQGTPPEAWFYLGEALSSDNSPAARDAYEKYLELVPKGHLADRARRAIQ